jgi:hypothetical protein
VTDSSSRGAHVFSLLQRHPRYSILAAGQTISQVGDFVYAVSLPFLLISMGEPPQRIAAVIALYYASQLGTLLVGGVLADRFARVRILLLSDIGRGGILAIMTFLFATGHLAFWQIALASATLGVLEALFSPSFAALVPDLVAHDYLPMTGAISQLGRQLAFFIGPLLAGVAIARFGIAYALGMDAATFAISIASLAAIISNTQSRTKEGDITPVARVREGLRYVLNVPWLWTTICIFALINAAYGGAVQIALSLFSKEFLGGALAFGALMSASAVGAAAVSFTVLATRWVKARSGIIAYSGIIAAGAALCGIAGSHRISVLLPLAFALGGGVALFDVVWSSTLQRLVRRDVLGRVVSLDMLGSFSLVPLGVAIAGIAVERVGSAATLLSAGLVVLLLGLGALSIKAIRSMP